MATGSDTQGFAVLWVRNFVQVIAGLLTVGFIALMIYAGYLWITARGDEAQVEKAKEYIKNAVIGLIIISLAYAIASFVFSKLG